MAIIFFNVGEAGQVGEFPRRNKLVSSDNLATITTAGYLNGSNTSGRQIYPTDIFDVIYSYTPTSGIASASGFGTGTYATFTCTITNGVITLVQWANPGDVLLPVVSGNIASFNGTTGQIQDSGVSATTPIFLGNVQAGISGTAGDFISYPLTASKGSFIFKAVANTGNTNSTLSNDAMGQASVINIPDPANAIGQLLIGATATPFVSGNFPQNSGTAGLMVDSGLAVSAVSAAVTQLGILNQLSVTLNTSQVTVAYGAPVNLIPAVAGKVIQIISASVYTASTGNTAYATGTAPIIQYGATVHGAGTLATGAGLVTGDITAAASQVRTLPGIASSALTGQTDVGIYFSNATNNYTAGTGTNVTFNIVYMLLTATI